MNIEAIMCAAPVIPALVIDNPENAVLLAEALVRGAIPAIEITLRTPAALDAIRAVKSVHGAIVGAGTVLNEADLAAAIDAGAEFIVTPGLTESLGRAAIASGIPFLPGVADAGDIMRGLDLGLTHFKFFPAATSGGVSALKALCAPFGMARFCPTGGIDQSNAHEWLALDQVICVGGSWLAPRGMPDVRSVEVAAKAASALRDH